MRELEFKRIVPSRIRVATRAIVGNDLSLRVDDVRVYDPKQNRNAITSGEIVEYLREGATVYVEAFKGFGATYRLATWEAAISINGNVATVVSGTNTADTAGANGYYPMGLFTPPTEIVVEVGRLTPGRTARLAFVFQSGEVVPVPWVPTEETETRTYRHEKKDRVARVVQLEDDEQLPTSR